MKYVASNKSVEAFQWLGDTVDCDMPIFIKEAIKSGTLDIENLGLFSIAVIYPDKNDDSQKVFAFIGDYLVRLQDGSVLPCKKELFESTFIGLKED